MLLKILVVLIGLWCTVYTASYGIFEYKKNKNPKGAIGVFALGTLVAFASLGIMLTNI